MRFASSRSAAALAIAALTFAVGISVATAQDEPVARALPEWNRGIRESSIQWRGADAAYSVPLAADRTLWLFGDTWITSRDAESRAGAPMIRNSLGVQFFNDTITIGPSNPVLYWKNDAGKPHEPFQPTAGPGWLWPLSGQRHGDRLFLFMSQLIKSDQGLGFASYGNVLVTVTNPDEAPPRWMDEQQAIPYFRKGEHGDRVFGCASVPSPDGEHVYIYGFQENWDEGFGARRLRIARTTWEALRSGDVSGWEFWNGEGWDDEVEDAAPLFDEAASEMSVHYDAARRRYIAVYTRFGWSEEILLRHAPAPQGPWSEAVVVYRCPDVQRNENYFCYAAKAHPELPGKPNEIIVTYATNSREFADHVSDPDLYWPQFIAVDLNRIPGL